MVDVTLLKDVEFYILRIIILILSLGMEKIGMQILTSKIILIAEVILIVQITQMCKIIFRRNGGAAEQSETMVEGQKLSGHAMVFPSQQPQGQQPPHLLPYISPGTQFFQKKRGRKQVRRSRKKKDRLDPASISLNIYCVNMNGFRPKKDSLKQILCEHDVDILVLTETKVHTNSSIKLEGYQLFPPVSSKRQGGGILGAIKYGLCSSIMVDKGEEAEFITARLRFDAKHITLVLVYGPQENDSVNKIRDFYDSISVEYQVERANLAGDSVFLVGDFIAKLGTEIIQGEIHQMSNNGACLNDIMEKYNLAVLNTLEICSGTFTRVKEKIPVEKSRGLRIEFQWISQF